MRKFLLGFVLLFVSVGASAEIFSTDCALRWDYNSADEAPLDGFRIYNNAVLLYTIPDPTYRAIACVDAGIVPGTYSLTMTAYNAEHESGHSDSLDVTLVVFPAPTNLRLTVTIE